MIAPAPESVSDVDGDTLDATWTSGVITLISAGSPLVVQSTPNTGLAITGSPAGSTAPGAGSANASEKARQLEAALGKIEKDYGKADLLLRLPFAEPMKAFRRIEDIPVVASPGRPRRDDLVRLTGCSPQKKWVLLSFTTLDWNEAALGNVESIENYEFFTVKPLEWKRRNIHPVDREKISFSDVLASVDVVISKPGFGLISECVVNRKPLVYSDRADFREYAILVESIDRYLRNQHIPSRELYAGDLKESLDAVWTRPEPKETVPAGGAAIAAKRIGEFLA